MKSVGLLGNKCIVLVPCGRSARYLSGERKIDRAPRGDGYWALGTVRHEKNQLHDREGAGRTLKRPDCIPSDEADMFGCATAVGKSTDLLIRDTSTAIRGGRYRKPPNNLLWARQTVMNTSTGSMLTLPCHQASRNPAGAVTSRRSIVAPFT